MKRLFQASIALFIAAAIILGCAPPPAPPPAAPTQVRPKAAGQESVLNTLKKVEDQLDQIIPLEYRLKSDPVLAAKMQTFLKDYLVKSIADFGAKSGLNVDAIKEAMATEKYKEEISAQAKQLTAAQGQGSTPSAFINGKKIGITGFDLDGWSAFIDEQLGKAPAAPAADPNAPPPPPAANKPRIQNETPFEFKLEGAASSGPETAPVTLVIFSDFECPYCSLFANLIKQLHEKYPNDVRIVFMNFPLEFHPMAMPAAMAAMAARDQGKFWEMHDWLFENIKTKSQEAKMEFMKSADAAKEGVKSVVQGADKLPESQVVFEDGSLLEDHLALIAKRFDEIDALRKQSQQKQPTGPDPKMTYKFNSDKRPVAGPADAKVELVLFSDFTCPYCKKLAATIDEVRKQFPNDVKVVFMSMANPRHQYAFEAHQAALEALAQGKFWEMHDKIMGSQDAPTPENLKKWAQEIGLDPAKIDAALANKTYMPLINDDISQADKAKINSTPTLFLNGKVQDAKGPEDLIKKIKELIAGGQAPAPGGQPPAPPPGGPRPPAPPAGNQPPAPPPAQPTAPAPSAPAPAPAPSAPPAPAPSAPAPAPAPPQPPAQPGK